MKLNKEELDALNMTENWFGGSMSLLDIFVASIRKPVMKDLVNLKLLRNTMFGWEITREGRGLLKDNNIKSWQCTRV